MNIYCETNFILEIVFAQEESIYCEKLISLCQRKKIRIILPSYSFAESIYRLENQIKLQNNFQKDLNSQITHFSRNSRNIQQIKTFSELDTFLNKNTEDSTKRLEECRKVLTKNAELISFDENVLKKVNSVKSKYDLTLQDAIIFTSILSHLQQNKASQSCFLNRNAKDFSTSEIKTKLKSLNCKLIPSFEDGLKFIDSQIK